MLCWERYGTERDSRDICLPLAAAQAVEALLCENFPNLLLCNLQFCLLTYNDLTFKVL